jgi:hypothetical protein
MAITFKDISYAQGVYNMAANTDPMVMMKASGFYTGSLQPYIDAQLDRNYADALQCHKIPFMYHFFVPAVDPLVQAAWFLRCVMPLAVGDGYALDVEIDGVDLVNKVLAFVTEHHSSTGCYPWVYLDRSLRQKYDWTPVFALCSEWIAAPDISFDANIPNVGVYVAQQGPIVNGVDTDEFFGSLDSLKKYTYQGVQEVTNVPTPTNPTPSPEAPAPSQPAVTPPVPPAQPDLQTPPPVVPPQAPTGEVTPPAQPTKPQNQSLLALVLAFIKRLLRIK